MYLRERAKQQQILVLTGKASLAVNQTPEYVVTTHRGTPGLFAFKAPADEGTETVVRELQLHFLLSKYQCWWKADRALANGRAA